MQCCACYGNAKRSTRTASHAGSWYSENPDSLRSSLEELLTGVSAGKPQVPKALIAPHAGLRHCGATAAHAFAGLAAGAGTVTRVVVLGPSHKKRIEGCALPSSSLEYYDTPFGALKLDVDALQDLRDTSEFDEFGVADDEAEHSVEMQLPFTALCMEAAEDWTLLPIVVGRIGSDACARYAELLTPYFDDPRTVFVISSDFCHWGAKFRYQPRLPAVARGRIPGMNYPVSAHPVNAGVEGLDLRGIEIICQQDHDAFQQYLEDEGNTICGRSAIRILLQLLSQRPGRFNMRFLHYSQSKLVGKDPGPSDSLVAYAAGIVEEATCRRCS